MAVTLQHLRTSTATKIPDGLAAGQLAFNLANGWACIGNGGNDILVKGVAVAAYATTATIFGVPNVAVPAKPTGKGYEIYQLASGGVSSGAARPTTPAVGTVFVDTAVSGKPAMLVWNGAAWVPPINPPAVYALSDAEYTAAAGGGVDAKALAALTAKVIGSKAAGTAPTLNSGDTLIIGGAGADAGTYIYNGTGWTKSGGSLPDATNRGTTGTAGTKGVVYLARDTDVQPAGVGTATPPDALAVATGAQVKALATLVAGMATGSTLLGRYDASVGNGQIAAGLTAAATAGTPARAGFIAGGKISAGSNAKEGDYFLVIKGGTVTGDAPSLNAALNANDHLVYDGAAWHVVASGVVAATPFSINDAADFDTDTVANVATADQKGLMMRDSSVGAGLDKAWKLVDVIDAGTF
jgi:hypothetical protein